MRTRVLVGEDLSLPSTTTFSSPIAKPILGLHGKLFFNLFFEAPRPLFRISPQTSQRRISIFIYYLFFL